jgi:hypothetical protein
MQEKMDEAEGVRREMQSLAKQFESSLIFRNEDVRQQQDSLMHELRL